MMGTNKKKTKGMHYRLEPQLMDLSIDYFVNHKYLDL